MKFQKKQSFAPRQISNMDSCLRRNDSPYKNGCHSLEGGNHFTEGNPLTKRNWTLINFIIVKAIFQVLHKAG